MQLLELQLRNWGPFYGEHRINLAVDPSAPVVLFRGENMRGKTSLLRAIVWCLYGQLREQDGRTRLPVEKMVNVDALQSGETPFGVILRFSHSGAEYVLHRSGVANAYQPDNISVSEMKTDLIPVGGLPYPAANIVEVIDGMVGRDIADFFFFDGEMLNRFEERLREERAASQGFVRTQVERALGLPFMTNLASDLETIQQAINANMDQALRREKKNNTLSEKYLDKSDELVGVEKDLKALRARDAALTAQIADYEAQMSQVEEIKELYYERKALAKETERCEDTIKDFRSSIANLVEANWWLPIADTLVAQLDVAEAEIAAGEEADRERYKLQFQADQISKQIGTGVCPACQQAVSVHNEAELKAELEQLQQKLQAWPTKGIDDSRRQRDRLRPFARAAASSLTRVFEQEQDLAREKLRVDKNEQRTRQISEQISSNTVDIDTLERTLVDLKATKKRSSSVMVGVEEKRQALKNEINRIANQIANQPGIDPTERRLQRTVNEAGEIVTKSFEHFRESMRDRVATATSALFRRLTTEKDYSGVRISEDYLLSVVDHQGRALSMISAGANQILTMAFIGALAECSVDEAPMVMDTPFGRLDTGHRSAILSWVSTFDTQVILFVQSGEYEPERHARLLNGKIGREYTIDRLSPTRSEVHAV
jgi:DNA sulfur modification protein DndD